MIRPSGMRAAAFRGGTALNKPYFAPPARYSEDIDLVQLEAGPIGPILDAMGAVLGPWLGEPKRTTGRTLGVATAWSHPPVRERLGLSGEETLAWPDAEGDVRGLEVQPLHPSVPKVARRDSRLHAVRLLTEVAGLSPDQTPGAPLCRLFAARLRDCVSERLAPP